MKSNFDVRTMLDLDGWEAWLYGVILPAGFIIAGVLGYTIGFLF
jgi:hypothetical protein